MDKSQFCPVPFSRLQLSSDSTYRPCCKFEGQYEKEGRLLRHPVDDFASVWSSDAAESLRSQFRAGLKPSECRECWREEEAGMYSLRKIVFEELDSETLNDYQLKDPSSPTTLDIKLSNLCNLKCRICGPGASSLWEQELREKEGSQFVSRHDHILNKKNLETLEKWLPKIERIDIFGGEPFINPEFYKILDLCIDSGFAERIKIHCNTNGTVFASKYIKHFEKFREISIYFSIDDVGDRLNYQRYPSDWNKISENLKRYEEVRGENSDFGINCTVSIFNVYHLPEVIEWTRTHSFYTGFNILHLPEFYSILNLPHSVKSYLVRRLENVTGPQNCQTLEAVIKFLQMPGDAKWLRQGLNEICKIDSYRQQKFSDLSPKMWELLNQANDLENQSGLSL